MLTKARSRRYPARMIKDVDYADGITLLANTHAQDQSLLHSLKRAAVGIHHHVNANKTEFTRFYQKGNISTLSGRSLKLMDKFTYLGSSISSTENDINVQLTKAWKDINRLSVIWKSDLSNKIVAYWPPTRPSCQNMKCTCYLHRCIRSKISGGDLDCRRGYIIIWRPPSSCERHNSHSIQPLDSQGHPWSPDIFDWMHLLFTQVHFFFWQLRRVGGQYATK